MTTYKITTATGTLRTATTSPFVLVYERPGRKPEVVKRSASVETLRKAAHRLGFRPGLTVTIKGETMTIFAVATGEVVR